MNSINVPLSISLMIVSGIVGLTAGYYISPTYQQTMYDKQTMGLGTADRFVDLRYINSMASHHKGAILLANQISTLTKREEIKKLAHDIQIQEPILINELYTWKQQWYNDGRESADPIVPQLGQSDESVDLRFLNALIAHHEAGIEMAQDIKTKSSRSDILDNANQVEQFLSNSLVMLKDWRLQWYSVQ